MTVPMIVIKRAMVVYGNMNMSIIIMTFFSAVNEIWTRDRSSKRNVWTIIGGSVPRAYLSYFFSPQLWSIWFLSSARGFWTITRGSKSLQFKTRSGRNSVTSQLLGLSARKFRRWSLTCVDEAINLSLCLMSSSVSTPFSMARWSVNCDLFVLPMGGVRAKQRNVKITIGGDSFSGFKNPAPVWISLNFVVTLNSFFLLSSARVGTTFWARSKACLWLTTAQIPRGLTGLSSRARS